MALVMAMALTEAACSPGGSNSSSLPTTPTTLNTETFTGTVPAGGIDFHNFTLAQPGEVDVTLTAAGPPSTIFVGLGLGAPSGTSCALYSGAAVATQAGATPQLAFANVAASTFCVAVFDIGNQLGDVSYTLTVAHP